MSIYPDKKGGVLTGRFRVEVMVNRRSLKGRADTMKEAKALEASLRLRLEQGEEAPLRRRDALPSSKLPTTVGEAAKRARGILWTGQDTEAQSFRKLDRIVSIVGEGLPVDAFDANVVDTVVSELTKGGCKSSTVNRYLSAISAFLKFCRKRGMRTTEVPEMEWRDQDEGRIRWITPDEETKLLALLPHPFDKLAYVAIRTGMRAMEILSLTPEQVEPRWVRLWETKNGSLRSVPITDHLYSVLGPIVSAGLPDYWQLRVQWDKARKAMGLEKDAGFVFHACRHSYATRAVEAGVNIRVLQTLMGHKTIQTTLRYAHVDDKTKTEAALMMAAKEGEMVGQKPSQKASRRIEGSAGNRRTPWLGSNGVSPLSSANPCTPVRFRLGPPTLTVT